MEEGGSRERDMATYTEVGTMLLLEGGMGQGMQVASGGWKGQGEDLLLKSLGETQSC